MDREVKNACSNFPQIAADICGELNVDLDYFEKYSERLKKDPVLAFRMRRVMDKLKRIDDEASASSMAAPYGGGAHHIVMNAASSDAAATASQATPPA